MVLIWYEYGLIGLLFTTILLLFAGGLFGFMRLRVQGWIGGAIGNFMRSLSEQAAEEEGTGSSVSSPSAGAFKIGGFAITPELLQTGVQLLKSLRDMGFIKGGSGGGGGW